MKRQTPQRAQVKRLNTSPSSISGHQIQSLLYIHEAMPCTTEFVDSAVMVVHWGWLAQLPPLLSLLFPPRRWSSCLTRGPTTCPPLSSPSSLSPTPTAWCSACASPTPTPPSFSTPTGAQASSTLCSRRATLMWWAWIGRAT